jgi:CelD/BcsL family acetyltransferase involved in cellulose biosynthesis
MRVTVVRPGELGPAAAASWSQFQKQSPVMSNPFLSLTFSQAVGKYRPGARVAVVEEGGRIEAFLPFEPGPGRIAVPIGDPMNDLQGFIGSGSPIDARAVVRKSGLRGWRFLHVPADQYALVPHHYKETTVQCPVIDLLGGYQSYQQSIARSATYKTAQKKRRSMERQLGPVSLVWGTADQAALRRLIGWKRDKYGGARQLFSDPSALGIVEELATADGADCRGMVSVMSAGDQQMAIALGLIGPSGLHVWFSSYNPDWGNLSPGTIMWCLLAEEAAARGIARIDFGGGQDSYKFSLANTSYPVAGGAVWVSRAEQAARHMYRQVRRLSVPAGPARRPAPEPAS